MKRLTSKQKGPYCSYCPDKTARAVYREDGFAGHFACELHKGDLCSREESRRRAEAAMTVADEETWGRL